MAPTAGGTMSRIPKKVIITIEDQPDGSVKVVATPNAKEMVESIQADGGTPAEGVAINVMTHMANESRKQTARKWGLVMPVIPRIRQ